MSITSSMVSSMAAYSNSSTNQVANKKDAAEKTGSTGASNVASKDRTEATAKRSNVSGQTIGKPQLTDKAAKYYEELKKKYSNMNFILVSKDQVENAKANAASFANPNKMAVLVDEEKIERMAEDENYRKQMEGVIANAGANLSSMASSLNSTGASVKGFGMQINNDGTASYFAVLEKSTAAQKERIEKKAEEKKEAKKAADKADRKKAQEKKLEEAREETAGIDKDHPIQGKKVKELGDDYVTFQANSMEELLQKIQDYQFENLSNSVQTDAEKQVGQKFDFSV